MGWRWGCVILVSGLFLWTLGCGDTKADPLWTVMVYMAGDNDLSDSAFRDMEEMEKANSSGRVNVVVQIDTLGETTRRLWVRQGKATLLEDLGERNMADPQTLQEFILWAKTRYPAPHHALILWSHGNGFAKVIPSAPRILQDDTDGISCCLSNIRIRESLEETGLHFDLLGLDASQMGQVETAYEFRKAADELVFSQETGQANGWDYAAILGALVGQPEMNAEDLAGVVVRSYRAFYENSAYPDYLTISAIRLKSVEAFTAGIDALGESLITALKDDALSPGLMETLDAVRDGTQELNPFTTPYTYIDLFDFLRRLKEQPVPETVLREIDDLLKMKDSVILSEWHGNARPHASGLSIVFFKLPEAMEVNRDDYAAYLKERKISFLADTSWEDFLIVYYQKAGFPVS